MVREGVPHPIPKKEGTLIRAWKNFDEKFLKRYFGGELHPP